MFDSKVVLKFSSSLILIPFILGWVYLSKGVGYKNSTGTVAPGSNWLSNGRTFTATIHYTFLHDHSCRYVNYESKSKVAVQSYLKKFGAVGLKRQIYFKPSDYSICFVDDDLQRNITGAAVCFAIVGVSILLFVTANVVTKIRDKQAAYGVIDSTESTKSPIWELEAGSNSPERIRLPKPGHSTNQVDSNIGHPNSGAVMGPGLTNRQQHSSMSALDGSHLATTTSTLSSPTPAGKTDGPAFDALAARAEIQRKYAVIKVAMEQRDEAGDAVALTALNKDVVKTMDHDVSTCPRTPLSLFFCLAGLLADCLPSLSLEFVFTIHVLDVSSRQPCPSCRCPPKVVLVTSVHIIAPLH